MQIVFSLSKASSACFFNVFPFLQYWSNALVTFANHSPSLQLQFGHYFSMAESGAVAQA